MPSRPLSLFTPLLLPLYLAASPPTTAPTHPLIRSAHSGPWSSPDTWESHTLPPPNSRVLILPTHHVTYDLNSSTPLWSVQVAGTLTFSSDRDTRLDTGLLLIRATDISNPTPDTTNLTGPPHAHHHPTPQPTPGHSAAQRSAAPDSSPPISPSPHPPISSPPTLEIGTPTHPISPSHHALLRLTYQPGMDPNTHPALICDAGRMDLHGSPLSPTWTKLRSPAPAGSTTLTCTQPLTGWRPGDHVIITTTVRPPMFKDNHVLPTVKDYSQTESRTIRSVTGQLLTLDRPLAFDHDANPDFAAEVANLSRNVVVETADPAGPRGHTMYHPRSSGSISYAEFRHLGKRGTLGRYPLHFHTVGDSMRGSYVLGASIWDSDNRFLTVHGTDYLVVRDCVGYQCLGHGFFCEDGTEVYNVFDHNLAVQALHASPLPGQILPLDRNDGAGFWWANSLNTFTRNTAAECDQYGFRFEPGKPPEFDPTLDIRQPDGSTKPTDIRTLPFVRFEDNESHSQRRYALNLGGFRLVAADDAYKTSPDGQRSFDTTNVIIGDTGGVGPDPNHPFVIRNFRAWRSLWAFHSASPSVLIDGLTTFDCTYGIWRTTTTRHQYRNLSFHNTTIADIFEPWGGRPDFLSDFNQSLHPTDTLPPQTIITSIEQTPTGDLHIEGTTADDGTVTQVLVNKRPARPTRPNYAQWSIDLPPTTPAPTQITAYATDSANHTELTPHTLPAP